MGWGYYIDARKNHGTPNEERRELIDWHKFDELYANIRHIVRYEAPDASASPDGKKPPEKVLTKDQLIDILHELERLPDYWADFEGEVLVPGVRCTNGFKTVERLCEIIELYDMITEKGWEIVFYYG